MSNVHVIRLGHERDAFFCPITRLHLVRGGVVQGTVPADADLRHIIPAVRSGGLTDVNGTIPKDAKPFPVAPGTVPQLLVREIKPVPAAKVGEAPVFSEPDTAADGVQAKAEETVPAEVEKAEKPRKKGR